MPFEDAFALVVLVLTAIILSIVALAKLAGLKAGIDELRRRIVNLEDRRETPDAQPATKASVPPPLPAFVTAAPISGPTTATRSAVSQRAPPTPFNWESILGVKLFAWIGGLALFLGVVFFVKYAFENNWITPAMRIVAGALIGIALLIVSLLPAVRRYRVPAQSVCATGILILYADIYAAHSFYGLIPLTVATALMWIATGGALLLANHLEAQSVAWLASIGGFLTPALVWRGGDHPVALFGYIAILNFGIAGLALLRRWNYLILLAAIGSVITESAWSPGNAGTARNVFLTIEAQFLAIYILGHRIKRDNGWSIGATAITGFAVFMFCSGLSWDFIFPILLLANCGLIALAVVDRSETKTSKALGAIIGAALILTWAIELSCYNRAFTFHGLNTPGGVIGSTNLLVAWYATLFLLFAAVPYFCGTKRTWAWMIAAVAGPLQFWFVYQFERERLHPGLLWLVPIAFALPAAAGVLYLVKKEQVDLASGDSRLATQGAAVLTFISLVFPVQFHREWITLGWAIEGLALILLFRWIPNRRLRAVSLIVLCAAFVRLAINPAVLSYHPHTGTPIWNWYLCAYGVSAICFFLSALWFGEPCEKTYERSARPLFYSLAGVVLFLLMNIQIADYFSIGPTLTFSFEGNFARDMTYTIAWSLFAFALLILGIARNVRAIRLVAIALLCIAFAKLFLHDLNSLSQLYRIGAFMAVAVIAIVASFLYQRFLSPAVKNT